MAFIVMRLSSIMEGAKLTAEETMKAISLGKPKCLLPIRIKRTRPAMSSLGWVVATSKRAALTDAMNRNDWMKPYTAPSIYTWIPPVMGPITGKVAGIMVNVGVSPQ